MIGWSSRIRDAADRDEGSTLPLIAGFTAVALALTLTIAAAGSLYLERKRALTVADGAALAAAESFPLGEMTLDETGVAPRLEQAPARAAAVDFLARDPDPRTSDLRLVDVSVADGRSATVTLETVWRPPMLTAFLPGGVTIDATATARSVFR
jgi:hypothetical protein